MYNRAKAIVGAGKEAAIRRKGGGNGVTYLPGRISDLATGLSNVDGDDFTHNVGISG